MNYAWIVPFLTVKSLLQAVFSVDEDVLLPCTSLTKAHLTWSSNPEYVTATA